MNSASIETSDRLQRVLSLIEDGKEHSTMDIIQRCNVCAVNSIIAELRDNSFEISCRREGRAWYYRMDKEAGA